MRRRRSAREDRDRCWCGGRRSAWVPVLDDRGVRWGPFPVCCDHLHPRSWPGWLMRDVLVSVLDDGGEWMGGIDWRYVPLDDGLGAVLMERAG